MLVPDGTDSVMRPPRAAQPLAEAAAVAQMHSRFVARALDAAVGANPTRRIDFLIALAAVPWSQEHIARHWRDLLAKDGALGVGASVLDRLARQLRRLRRDVVLGTLVRDVAGSAPLEEVTTAMTALAEIAVAQALHACARELAQRYGVPTAIDGTPQDLLVIAMGKAGAGELNVSSDLDLVLAYHEEGETTGDSSVLSTAGVDAPSATGATTATGATSAAATAAMSARGDGPSGRRRIGNREFFERLGRSLIQVLSDVTADGFVFRLDLRLRPNGASGPLAISCSALEEYLLRQGREWERFAWLKARVIAPPVFATAAQLAVQSDALAATVRPFVFRKYLDFDVFQSLRELHAKIRAQTQRREFARGEEKDNVKLGRGGIREIEFIAQTFQIVRGGRDPRLTDRRTLCTLQQLARAGVLRAEICQRLADAYVFLRQLEHALQYVDDAQTHLVPAAADERAHVAALLALPVTTLLLTCARQRDIVAAEFDAIFLAPAGAQQGAAGERDGWRERLTMGEFSDQSAARIEALLRSRRVLAMSELGQRAVATLLARAIDAIASPDVAPALAAPGVAAAGVTADDVLARFVGLLEAIAGRSTYVTLLAQYPHAFARVLRLLAASGWAADYLARHPLLLDELLDERLADLNSDSAVDYVAWCAELSARLAALATDTERALNLVSDAHKAQLFRLLIADTDGRLSVERLADHLSALADVTLALALECSWRDLPRRIDGAPRFAVIGYGKLGGKELGYASDLDIVLVYDDADARLVATGLDSAEIYGALGRRLILWLTTQTSSGSLFEIDLRLRPDGDKGLLVTPLAAFERYQREEHASGRGMGAWTWERQALTRARYCAGDRALGAQVEALRASVLARARNLAALRADVLAMRKRMRDGHPNASGLFDIKHDPGGMVDVEFAVQFLVLAHAHAQVRLIANLSNAMLPRLAISRTCACAWART